MRTIAKIALAFAFMVAFLESVSAGAKWRRGDELGWWEWALVGALPVLIGIYLRYFSIFGRRNGRCLTPPDERQP